VGCILGDCEGWLVGLVVGLVVGLHVSPAIVGDSVVGDKDGAIDVGVLAFVVGDMVGATDGMCTVGVDVGTVDVEDGCIAPLEGAIVGTFVGA